MSLDLSRNKCEFAYSRDIGFLKNGDEIYVGFVYNSTVTEVKVREITENSIIINYISYTGETIGDDIEFTETKNGTYANGSNYLFIRFQDIERYGDIK